jgi:hypothetical protein
MSATLLHISNPAWTALAAWAGVGLALLAGLVAFFQFREARRLRLEQAQPYVVAFIDESPADWSAIDLVIKNFGTTAATKVRVTINPAPQRAADTENKDVWIPKSIPVLVPGQEWRCFWDMTQPRLRAGLPDHHTATVEFCDSRSKVLDPYEFDLDWEPITQRATVMVHGSHQAAQALRDMRDTLAGWKESGGGLRVFARDGDARDERAVEARKQREAQVEQDTPEGS